MASSLASMQSSLEVVDTLSKENDERAVVEIDGAGDLILEIFDEAQKAASFYRVSSKIMKKSSTYFEALLDPTKFKEGASTSAVLERLGNQVEDFSIVVSSDLPIIRIEDAGQFPKHVSNRVVVTHFLEILHGCIDIHLKHSMIHTALLAVVADRFSALKRVANYVSKKVSKYSSKEVYWRQKILTGFLLNLPEMVLNYSRLLIMRGSERWSVEDESTQSTGDTEDLWWNLPGGLEELLLRRECMLATLSSLQDHYIALYSSPKQQCRLGYDSSPQCDSFQLGEMIRFFSRKGTLSLQSNIVGQDYKQSYIGSIESLFLLWRQCPSYQLDRNHSHCGLRTSFIPRLEYVETLSRGSGVCLRCWKGNKAAYSWFEGRTQERWILESLGGTRKCSLPPCGMDHQPGKALFTAASREWESET